MVLFESLTPAQEKIIRDLCYYQLSSLRRVYNNEHESDEDLVMLLIENEISKDDWNGQLEVSMERIKACGVNPNLISKLDKSELNMLKHILCNIEHNYQNKYPQALSNVWNRLFVMSDFKISSTSLN